MAAPQRIFIANLNYEVTETMLMEDFSQFGEIEHCQLVRDQDTNRSRGFGFIVFQNGSGAMSATSLDNATYRGRSINVQIARQQFVSDHYWEQGISSSSTSPSNTPPRRTPSNRAMNYQPPMENQPFHDDRRPSFGRHSHGNVPPPNYVWNPVEAYPQNFPNFFSQGNVPPPNHVWNPVEAYPQNFPNSNYCAQPPPIPVFIPNSQIYFPSIPSPDYIVVPVDTQPQYIPPYVNPERFAPREPQLVDFQEKVNQCAPSEIIFPMDNQENSSLASQNSQKMVHESESATRSPADSVKEVEHKMENLAIQ